MIGTYCALSPSSLSALPLEGRVPGISVLKPLKGVDAGLRENLESFFQLDYPDFELLISVARADDPAAKLVSSLLIQYPAVKARLVVGEVAVGQNPKVNNLIRSYDRAANDWLLISDSNTRVPRDYLWSMVPELRREVGVATAVVAGRGAEGLAARLESSYLNTFFARWIHLAAVLGNPFVIGKSMCFRKSTAERFGGIRSLAHVIAEDNMFGEAVKRLGLKVSVMAKPIGQHIGDYSFRAFWARHVRWGRIRKSQAPIAFLFEPMVTALFSGLLGAFGADRLLGASFEIFLMIHLLVWFACDFYLMRRLTGISSVRDVFAWLVRESLAIPHWLHMALGNTVQWRGSPLKLSQGGVVTPNQ